MRRTVKLILSTALALVVSAPAAGACGSLVAANGAVSLLRTTTLAAWSHGVEHYVTSFQFAGTPESFGSIVPLPGEPTKVEKGGDWTFQRLQLEVAPPVPESDAAPATTRAGEGKVEVLQQVQIDSLDVAILKGGGRSVARWADDNGYSLSKDTPEILEFYSERSPYFMAAKFDPSAAREQGLNGGDGTPVHLTIPTPTPWVPLRILGTDKPAQEIVAADVFLLTPREPTLLAGDGITIERSEPASDSLLDDLRSDRGMKWVPERMWLTFVTVAEAVEDLDYDLAIDVHGDDPDVADTGVEYAGVWNNLNVLRGTR